MSFLLVEQETQDQGLCSDIYKNFLDIKKEKKNN